MKKSFEKIINSKWSGVLSLSIGTVFSQGINVVIQPLLTRLLTPSELGQYSYILSIANLFIPIASLNLHLLIVTAKDDTEAERITELSIFSVLFLTIIYYLVILFSQYLANYSTFDLILLLTITPLIIFTSGVYQIFVSRDNRMKQYTDIATAEITKVGTMGVVQIISGFLNFGVIGQLTGKLLSPVYYLRKNVYFIIKTLKNISLLDYINNIKKYLYHVIYSVPSQFISSFSYTLIMLSIVSLYSTEEVGYYSVSVRVLGLPIILISYNLSKVYLQKISDNRNNNESLLETYLDTVKKLLIISIVIFTSIAVVAPKITEIIFGEGFEEAGYYISILCVMFSVRLVASSLTGTFIVVGKQNIQMILEIFFVMVGSVAYITATILNLTIYKYLIMISILYALVYAIILIYMGIQCNLWDEKNINQ